MNGQLQKLILALLDLTLPLHQASKSVMQWIDVRENH